MSNRSFASTAFILLAKRIESVIRATEPELGTDRGVPIRINRSPNAVTSFDAGAMTFT